MRIDVSFLVLAAICLLAGISLGIVMGIAHDFSLAPVHAHANLVGWTSLALFGLVYRAYPTLARSRLALAHLILAGPSAFLFPAGIYLSITQNMPALAIATSLVWFTGAVLFLLNLVRGLVLTGRQEASLERPALV